MSHLTWLLFLLPLAALAIGTWWWGRARADAGGRRTGVDACGTGVGGLGDTGRELVVDVAHELRNPLTVILGQLDAALVEQDPEARAHQIRVAHRQARRLARLADQALELTRLEEGRLRSTPRPFEAVGLLETLVMSFAELADRKGAELDFIARPRLIPVVLDPGQLATIVTNLVSDALKHTSSGGRVGVALDLQRNRDQPREQLIVTVASTGSRVESDRLEGMFDAPPEPAIGFLLAKRLTELNGGTLRAEPVSGRGAKFVVALPRGGGSDVEDTGVPVRGRPQVTEEILHRTTESLYSGGADGPTEGFSLLVLEHDADLLEWMGGELGTLGTVVTAQDCTTGLLQARESLPDIVVTDARMPGMSGVELCRRLRADERTSHIPVLMLSARSSVEDRIEGIEAGADAYVAKPVDARELKALVEGLLERARVLRERFREQIIVRPSDVSTASVDQRFFEKVMDTIEAKMDDGEFSVPDLANAMALSTSQLTRKLRALVGQSPGRLIRSVRLRRAADLIEARSHNLTTIAHMVGFSDQSHFSRAFKQLFGVPPSEYGKERRAP